MKWKVGRPLTLPSLQVTTIAQYVNSIDQESTTCTVFMLFETLPGGFVAFI
jgi:hypothetical protein